MHPFMTTRPSWKIWSLSPMCHALTSFVLGIKYRVVFSPVYFSKGLLPSHSLVSSITLLKKERAYKKETLHVLWKKRTLSLYSSQVTHPASAYPSFHSMKWPGVKLILPGWDASPMQGYHSSFHQASLTICRTHLYSWVEGDSVRVRWLSKNTTQWPDQVLNPDLSTQSLVY